MTVLVLGCLWVIAGTIVACLPMRYQYAPGIVLLATAPVLIYLIGATYGFIPAAAAVFGFVSMFRNPIRYFARRALGQNPEIPK